MESEEKPNKSETGARAACPLFADKQTNALFKVNLNYQESRVFASRQTAGRLPSLPAFARFVYSRFHSAENYNVSNDTPLQMKKEFFLPKTFCG